MLEMTVSVLRQSLVDLEAFSCPSHHRHYYQRTYDALTYLLEPENVSRVIFLRNSTFAPVCADLVPDSGVAFLRGIGHGPADIAAEAEQSCAPEVAIFRRAWENALGIEYAEWHALADRSPVIFVRLGHAIRREDGRWGWGLLPGDHLLVAYDSVQDAFDHLAAICRLTGDDERLHQLLQLRYGVLPA